MTVTLGDHLRQMHAKAIQLEGLVAAINACIDDPERRTVCISMVEAAAEIAPDLVLGLDSADTRFSDRHD